MTMPSSKLPTLALGNSIAKFLELPTQLATSVVGGALDRTSCGCAIPTPCWEPKHEGTCRLTLMPGNKANIRLHILNCGWRPQVVLITGLGKLAGWMTFSPTTMSLGPQERATMNVTVQVPDGINTGERLSGPVIIRGCRDHFVRVEVTVGECGLVTCGCDIEIDDCADNVHHWYDHFYCPRPCNATRQPGTKDG